MSVWYRFCQEKATSYCQTQIGYQYPQGAVKSIRPQITLCSWCLQMPNSRLWLCERTARGAIPLQTLNKMPVNTRFGDLRTDMFREQPWLTLFRERWPPDEYFPCISDNDVTVFCKLYDPEANVLTYEGSLQISRSERCLGFINRLANLAEVPVGIGFDVYIEEGDLSVRHISNLYVSILFVSNAHGTSHPSRCSLSADGCCFWIGGCRASEA